MSNLKTEHRIPPPNSEQLLKQGICRKQPICPLASSSHPILAQTKFTAFAFNGTCKDTMRTTACTVHVGRSNLSIGTFLNGHSLSMDFPCSPTAFIDFGSVVKESSNPTFMTEGYAPPEIILRRAGRPSGIFQSPYMPFRSVGLKITTKYNSHTNIQKTRHFTHMHCIERWFAI